MRRPAHRWLLCSPWKDKILDYEIETENRYYRRYGKYAAWKDKILDYEIETDAAATAIDFADDLKR